MSVTVALWAALVAGGFSAAMVLAGDGRPYFLYSAMFAPAAALLLAIVNRSAVLRDARRVARLIDPHAGTTASPADASRIRAATAAIQPVASAAQRLIETVHAELAESRLRQRTLEIELKVATAERQHAQAIIYSISDAVLVTDTFDELVLANESAARALGFDLSQDSRLPVDRIVRDAKVVDLIREVRHSNSRNGRRIVEHRVKGETGERTYKITLSCVNEPDGDPHPAQSSGGVVTVLHDMTREKEVAEMKNDFVSSVSHELRTPLASIKAYVEMLIDGEAADERTRREFYDVIQNESNRLGRLIDNILNISRIEAGLVKVSKTDLSLTVVIKEALEVISPQARQKNIRIDEQITPVFFQVNGDRDMLYQAVLNLLSNAVKYTPDGGVITVTTVVDEQERRVLTRISDTGVGIPAKDLPFVFDKFYRVDANNHMAKGTGLGLSLVKHIVEGVHRGRVFVESTVGQGTTFGVELGLSD